MLAIKKILLPVDFPNACLRVIHQATTLARHFHAEIVLLHVVTPASHAAGVPQNGGLADWDLLAEIVNYARKSSGQTFEPALDGLTIQRVLVKGSTAQAIMQTAQREKADLIMMPSHGRTFDEFLLGTSTAEVLHTSECPVWTGAHFEESPDRDFAIRNVLCVVDFKARDRKTLSWAAHVAAEFDARLTLAGVTGPVEFLGPGGSYTDPKWKRELIADATQQIAVLQRAMGIKAEVFIGSGDACKVLSQAARQTRADVLVTGCHPFAGRLRTHGFKNICAVPIPVLSV